MADGHPFGDEMPAVDGNFYPHDSKLRPEIVIDDEDVEIPPYFIL
jgi:hypothetical protein